MEGIIPPSAVPVYVQWVQPISKVIVLQAHLGYKKTD